MRALATVFTPNKGFMNRRSIMIASALFLSVGATRIVAQEIPHPSFGLLGGVDFAKITGENDDDVKSRTGFVGGLSLKGHVAGHFYLEVDGLYSQEGAKEGDGDNDLTLKLDYIRVPVQLGFRFPTHSSVHPFVSVGPSFGFKVACKATAGDEHADCDDAGFDVKKFDFAGVASAGVGFKVGGQELSLQARYTKGFTNIANGDDSGDAKNQNFAVLAGFAF
jgi:Outer membrane protein beta-barrel domain